MGGAFSGPCLAVFASRAPSFLSVDSSVRPFTEEVAAGSTDVALYPKWVYLRWVVVMVGDGALSAAQFSILLALAEGEMHGYAIMRDSAERGGARLGAATLYRSIKQLLDAGLISEAGERVDATQRGDERRRYYRMTDVGRRAAQAEAGRLAQLVTRAHGRGLLSGASLRSPGPA